MSFYVAIPISIQIEEFSSSFVATGYVNTKNHYSLSTSVLLACPHELLLLLLLLLLYSSLWCCFALSILKAVCVKCLVKLPVNKSA